MIFYDFEIFKYDWLTVAIDMNNKQEYVISNDPEALKALYEAHVKDVWVGYNNKHYDQYIIKAVLLGMDPKEVSDQIIVDHMDGWQISKAFNKIPMCNYDVMASNDGAEQERHGVGLKTLEAFLGANIKETDVDFNIDRKLTTEELKLTEHYCRSDVENTIKVFLHKVDDFKAIFSIVRDYKLPIDCLGDSEAQITAKVLSCQRQSFDDEFDIHFFPCLRLNKYKYVQSWFEEKIKEAIEVGVDKMDEYPKREWYKAQSLTTDVAGVPHTFGFGGLHGAIDEPIHLSEKDGAGYHVDVNNYYPSMLIAWDIVTRSATNNNYAEIYKTRKELKYKQTHAKTKEESKMYKKMQLPYKKMLNALSGSMKDRRNPAYDPRNNNIMCINGQLMLLDLIEHLEVIPGFRLVQSNTDGLIVWIPNTDEAFEQMDDICFEWEMRCSTDKCDIKLELDCIREIYQKDVNNYLWVDVADGIERKGAYLKELSPIDYDLPIINKALVDYMAQKIPVEKTIGETEDLLMFQKVVKLSGKYGWVEHEHCEPILRQKGVRVIKTWYEYPTTQRYSYKTYRVFASKDLKDGRLLKCGGKSGKGEKFASTPDHCFIFNDSCEGVGVPEKLDRQWYINMAKERLKQFNL